MNDEKFLERAKCLLGDAKEANLWKEGLDVSQDVDTIKWLVQQAQKAQLYRKALGELSNGKIRTHEQSHLIASSALIEAEFFFNDKIFPQERTVKNDG